MFSNWLNTLKDVHHFCNITKLGEKKNKKKHWQGKAFVNFLFLFTKCKVSITKKILRHFNCEFTYQINIHNYQFYPNFFCDACLLCIKVLFQMLILRNTSYITMANFRTQVQGEEKKNKCSQHLLFLRTLCKRCHICDAKKLLTKSLKLCKLLNISIIKLLFFLHQLTRKFTSLDETYQVAQVL